MSVLLRLNKKIDETLRVAMRAYAYALPLVVMDLTQGNMTKGPISAPINQFLHKTALVNAADRVVVRSNVDTMYSTAFLDLSAGPIVFSKPATERYCSVAVFDAYTNCVEILGTGGRDGGAEAVYVLAGPEHDDAPDTPSSHDTPLPIGATRLDLPTNMAWVIARTAYFDEGCLEEIGTIQKDLTLVPLSQYGGDFAPKPPVSEPEYDYVPLDRLLGMDIETFFNAFNRLSIANPPAPADTDAIEQFKTIGVGPGETFSLGKFDETLAEMIWQAVREELGLPPDLTVDGFKALLPPDFLKNKDILDRLGNPHDTPIKMRDLFEKVPSLASAKLVHEGIKFATLVNNWRYLDEDIARFGANYEYRALVALTGLGANPVDMAIYPTAYVDGEGQTLNGKNSYTIRFEKGLFPPCDAFWSITAYDEEGFLFDNPIDRYLFNTRDVPNFAAGEDGSVTIYLQADPPPAHLQNNWLPVPKDVFQLTLRIYQPRTDALDLTWRPPPIAKT
ncbi:MAG: DUF1214 domain-containing protein [Clostridiales bacterium]|nr:DUF1214 domain-containing protein [Clostridiales bacterium]